MCGMFASVTVSNEVDLPHFPEEIGREGLAWQSKDGLDVYGGPYRITADGRLEQKKISHREKTEEEKQAEAEKWGFDSWDAYVQAYEEFDYSDAEVGAYPDAVEFDVENSEQYQERPPLLRGPTEKMVDEEWWGDVNYHGTFEFHQVIQRDPVSYNEEENEITGEIVRLADEHALDVYFEYEARFSKGELDEIVFMGERFSDSEDPIDVVLEQIEAWRDWREENVE